MADAARAGAPRAEQPRGSLLYDPALRGAVYQIVTFAIIVFLVWGVIHNTAVNLERRNIAQGFGFWDATAGFDIAQSLIAYPPDASYGRAIWVGIFNTLLVAGIGIFFATLLGFVIGIARLSSNFVISRLATLYVEVIRNIPLLLQIFFWYFAVLQVLPAPRNSLQPVTGWVFINNRGLVLPEMKVSSATSWGILLGIVLAIAAGLAIAQWARKRQEATGQQFPSGLVFLGLILGLPLLGMIVTGFGFELTPPNKSTFNITGGTRVIPECVALVFALSIYTASFIAEIVRAGILSVSHGQTEAAMSLGLKPGWTLRFVVIPQAMRVITPPLTSQYLNLTKNSSLAVAIGYPDLVYTGGTVLNQTGQAIEVIAIWMLVYLGISLATSLFMNWYNARMAIVER
jgi:general L-amino acid transport system permease protein